MREPKQPVDYEIPPPHEEEEPLPMIGVLLSLAVFCAFCFALGAWLF